MSFQESIAKQEHSLSLKLSLLQEGLSQQIDDLNSVILESRKESTVDFRRIQEANKRLKHLIHELPELSPDYVENIGEFDKIFALFLFNKSKL